MCRILLAGAVLGWACTFAQAQIAIARPGIILESQVQLAPGAVSSGGVIVNPGLSALQKSVQSEWVVSGKVTIEKETVDLPQYPGAPVKTSYKVATIKVDDVLVGQKTTALRVLLMPADPAQIPFEMPGRVQPYYRPNAGQIQLIDGQEGVFFLSKSPQSTEYANINYGCAPLNPLDTKYKENLAAVKKVAATFTDPVKALKAVKAEDRTAAAFAIVSKYRRYPQTVGAQPTQESIPAEESKLIFQAILDADWELWDKPQNPGEVRDYQLSPTNLLSQLGIFPGQKGAGAFPQVQPMPGQGYHAAYKATFKTWLEGDGAKYEIKKFVAAKAPTPKK